MIVLSASFNILNVFFMYYKITKIKSKIIIKNSLGRKFKIGKISTSFVPKRHNILYKLKILLILDKLTIILGQKM